MTQKVTELVSSGITDISEVKRHIHLYITKPIYETIIYMDSKEGTRLDVNKVLLPYTHQQRSNNSEGP